MLVLTRRIDESICVDNNVKFKILEIKNHHVSIGVIAPKQMRILRSELCDNCATCFQDHKHYKKTD